MSDTPESAFKPGTNSRRAMLFAVLVIVILGAVGLMVGRYLTKSGGKHHRVIPRDTVDDPLSASTADSSTDIPTGKLTISLDQPGVAISPSLLGLSLEEINHSLDGGLYANLLPDRNLSDLQRSIQGGKIVLTNGRRTIAGGTIVARSRYWMLVRSQASQADLSIDTTTAPADTAARSSLRLTVSSLAQGQRAGLSNPGYWGVPVKPDCLYHASFYTKASDDFGGPLSITIESNDGTQTFASASVDKVSSAWKRYDVDLQTDKTVSPSLTNRFVFSTTNKGTLWFAEACLFPPTFNNRPNGNRIDLMEKLAALKPAFIVFPGGDSLLGDVTLTGFHWKSTIGPAEKRYGQPSTWHHTSNGFGLMEFLLTCEDLKAKPVLGIFDGTSIFQKTAPGPSLQPFVQDALDEIEYVTGEASTAWGARRAADGHPQPFDLDYLQIGNNEQVYSKDTYDARFTQFYDAIKAAYPKLKLIGWMHLATTRKPDVLHESFYPTAHDLMSYATDHYDEYPRNGQQYASEFNAKEGDPTKTLNAALADMSWMLNVQTNADVVTMATAAPTFINVNGGAAQHPANLIGYDSLSSFGSPSFYALKMFNENRGDTTVPIVLDAPELPDSGPAVSHGAIGVGSWGSDVQYKDIKVTAPDGKVLYQSDFSNSTQGWKLGTGDWKADDGTLHQTSNLIGCTAMAGDPKWTDYTLTLKAKKIAGNEGFLIIVHSADDGNFGWWNLGGWSNTLTGFEQTLDGGKIPLLNPIPNRIETGKWYDIRVEVNGQDIVCYLDNTPILTATERPPPAPTTPVFAAASTDSATGDVILKVVNVLPQPVALEISLDGTSTVQEKGTVEVMSGSPGDVNSINAPQKVFPRQLTVHIPGREFSHKFPACSISILRLRSTK